MKFANGWEKDGDNWWCDQTRGCGKYNAPYINKTTWEGACVRCAEKMGVFVDSRRHHNTSRKTARERAVYVINRGALAEDIEKQIQLAVKAYAKRKANRK